MVASDSPGTSTALAFADARMRFIWVNQRGFGWGLIKPLAMEIGEFVYLWRARLDG